MASCDKQVKCWDLASNQAIQVSFSYRMGARTYFHNQVFKRIFLYSRYIANISCTDFDTFNFIQGILSRHSYDYC